MPAPRKRGFLLSAYLLLMIVANFLLGLYYLTNGMKIVRSGRSSEAVVSILAVGALLAAVSAVQVWRWRRAGFWVLVLLAVFIFGLNTFNGVGLGRASLGLLGPVILGVLIWPKWQSFK